MLLRKPEDVSLQLGESAQFFCEADGDPMPSVEWSREQGPLPNGRSEKYREHWEVLLAIDLNFTLGSFLVFLKNFFEFL